MKSKNLYFAKSQQGIATVLTVALVGIALIVSIAGTAYYLRAKQYAVASNHALTQAQADVWTGVEIVQQYLNSRSASQLDTLRIDGIPAITNLPPNIAITAKIDSVNKLTSEPGLYTVTSTITSRNTISKSASTVQVVYEVELGGSAENTNPPSGGSNTLTNAMNFYGDLDASGGIKLSNAGDRAIVNVTGNFITRSGLSGIKELKVLGDVDIEGSGISGLKSIYSKGNVYLGKRADNSGSGAVDFVSAMGTVNILGGGWTVGDIYADNDIIIVGGKINSASTLRNIIIPEKNSNPNVGTLTAKGNINLYNAPVQNARALGNINILAGWKTLSKAVSHGTLTCYSGWQPIFQASNYKNCPNNGSQNVVERVNPQGAYAFSIADKPKINAYDYEAQANYIFSIDSKANIKVKVQNINGITSGEYYLANNPYDAFQGQPRTYLCKAINSNKACNSISDVIGNLGTATWGTNNTPVTYDATKKEWTLQRGAWTNTLAIAPGVLFFKGSLNIGDGDFANSIIATGNIKYGQNTTLEAPNYAQAVKTCNASGFNMPLNICSSTSSLILESIGNIALLSGSCESKNILSGGFCTPDQYIGGDITLGSSTNIKGNIIAGNKLITGGSTNLVGSILVAGLGKDIKSSLQGSTTIDFNGISDEKTAIDIPNKDDSNSDDGSVPLTITTIKWARYL